MQLQILTPVTKFLKSRFPSPGPVRFVAALALIAMGGGDPKPAIAQSLFSPAILVNQDAITHFELEQRVEFLRMLRAPGDPVKIAREALIEDRLKLQVLAIAGMEASPEDVEAGMEAFASRSNLTTEEFVKTLAEGGVSRETMRDFVKIGILWREYIRARYVEQARPTQAEIDRALGRAGGRGGVRVLLSEIIIPITPQTIGPAEALAEEISQAPGSEAFAAAATQYSASETRTDGGKMEWLPLSKLPPQLHPLILGLAPGENTAPIALPNAIAIFRLRGIQETNAPAPRYASIDYATYYIAGGRTPEARGVAQTVSSQIDTCNDLYGIAQGQPPEVLTRQTKKPGEIPRDIALELAKLDENEISTALTTVNGQTLILLMLCSRTTVLAEDATRDEVADALILQRLETLSGSLLDQLKADALIIDK